MPLYHHFYTEFFLDKNTPNQVDQGKVDKCKCSISWNAQCETAQKNINGRLQEIEDFSSIAELVNKLKNINELIEIGCENDNEINELIEGKEKTLYYTGENLNNFAIKKTIDL